MSIAGKACALRMIISGTIGKIDVKTGRLVEVSIVGKLEKGGFIDSVYRE